MSTRPGIIDLGIGNSLALVSMSRSLGHKAETVEDSTQLSSFTHLILPGVGNYSRGVDALDKGGFREAIMQFAHSGKPLLGICLGMQLLGSTSEESELGGLSLLNFRVDKLPTTSGAKVPHIGWNFVKQTSPSKLLSGGIGSLTKYYFNHSFALLGSENSASTGTSDSGGVFTAIIEQQNIFGVQFHPEKSHQFGKELLNRFLSL